MGGGLGGGGGCGGRSGVCFWFWRPRGGVCVFVWGMVVMSSSHSFLSFRRAASILLSSLLRVCVLPLRVVFGIAGFLRELLDEHLIQVRFGQVEPCGNNRQGQ